MFLEGRFLTGDREGAHLSAAMEIVDSESELGFEGNRDG